MDPVSLANLLAVKNLPGYAVIMEIFDKQVKRLEAEVFNVPPQNESEVIAAHRIAVGARWTLTETAAEIEQLAKLALMPPPQTITREQEDELYIKSLQQ